MNERRRETITVLKISNKFDKVDINQLFNLKVNVTTWEHNQKERMTLRKTCRSSVVTKR